MAATTASSILLSTLPRTLLEYGHRVLTTSNSIDKATLTLKAYDLYRKGQLPIGDQLTEQYNKEYFQSIAPPAKPARPDNLITVDPTLMYRDNSTGSFNSIRLIHSLAHIESYAIDLSWDILCRWAYTGYDGIKLPAEFYSDWVKVAADESMHFTVWSNRLIELGSSYGSLSVHDGLYQSATDTSHSLLARLAIVHLVHEARGLDVSVKMTNQLNSTGDKKSAKLLQSIELDELTHVTAGMRWFTYITNKQSIIEPIPIFHSLVRQYFKGVLKGPFNHADREKAGFTKEWYLPLTSKSTVISTANTIDSTVITNNEEQKSNTIC